MIRNRKRTAARTPAAAAGAEPGPGFEITFDGRPVHALPGRSIAAVLWADSVLTWRTTRVNGRPRGAFCGIGSCFDCLVTVNGVPGRRACLQPARPGDVVTTQEGDGHAGLRR
ncbi:(2Fe-2S)-binding protein [Streptomyces sp. DT20]|uniref:(2Fe-2S)-binding protein n=1 Tax=unclassified Streptomyces TaxID=2593676 RepID=UPI0009394F0F|nr:MULTISPECIES: (2Fe-2S)-binding protein [unclassified Streptomyces]OKK21508.1 proline dehydrogenase [Streptomyces sp. CB02488]WRZ15184.1 (2Fe-2S)-binding protein [Streptomyces sp. NBC_00341]